MHTYAGGIEGARPYPVALDVRAATEGRNRLTVAFRFFLALPHLLLVGGPAALVGSITWQSEGDWTWGWSSGSGVLGLVAWVAAMIAWFALLFTGRYPDGLWKLNTYYLRWRVRAIAYMTLLRDEYPPFGEGAYPVDIALAPPDAPRDRLTIAFRVLLALPHLCVLWVLGMAWAFTTAIAWIVILVTGRYPLSLYGFAIGVFAWGARVEAYLLLLRDEYPPFTLRA